MDCVHTDPNNNAPKSTMPSTPGPETYLNARGEILAIPNALRHDQAKSSNKGSNLKNNSYLNISYCYYLTVVISWVQKSDQ